MARHHGMGRAGAVVTWIDVGQENRDVGHEEAVTGVLFRSEDGAWRVAADDLKMPVERRRWVVWDCRTPVPRNAVMGVTFPTREVAQVAAEALMGSKLLRLRSGLKAVWRAHLNSFLSGVRSVLAAEVDR